jgi:hypothetical protein
MKDTLSTSEIELIQSMAHKLFGEAMHFQIEIKKDDPTGVFSKEDRWKLAWQEVVEHHGELTGWSSQLVRKVAMEYKAQVASEGYKRRMDAGEVFVKKNHARKPIDLGNPDLETLLGMKKELEEMIKQKSIPFSGQFFKLTKDPAHKSVFVLKSISPVRIVLRADKNQLEEAIKIAERLEKLWADTFG